MPGTGLTSIAPVGVGGGRGTGPGLNPTATGVRFDRRLQRSARGTMGSSGPQDNAAPDPRINDRPDGPRYKPPPIKDGPGNGPRNPRQPPPRKPPLAPNQPNPPQDPRFPPPGRTPTTNGPPTNQPPPYQPPPPYRPPPIGGPLGDPRQPPYSPPPPRQGPPGTVPPPPGGGGGGEGDDGGGGGGGGSFQYGGGGTQLVNFSPFNTLDQWRQNPTAGGVGRQPGMSPIGPPPGMPPNRNPFAQGVGADRAFGAGPGSPQPGVGAPQGPQMLASSQSPSQRAAGLPIVQPPPQAAPAAGGQPGYAQQRARQQGAYIVGGGPAAIR